MCSLFFPANLPITEFYSVPDRCPPSDVNLSDYRRPGRPSLETSSTQQGVPVAKISPVMPPTVVSKPGVLNNDCRASNFNDGTLVGKYLVANVRQVHWILLVNPERNGPCSKGAQRYHLDGTD